MIIHRDIGSSYHHKPMSRGGILPSHSGEKGGDVGEGEEAAGGDSSSGFPSNLCRFILCFVVFMFLCRLLARMLWGVFI
jgi:hypothetical protein